MSDRKKMQWENDYQVGSGAKFTCAKFTNDCHYLSGGDDQSNLVLWKVTNNKPKFTLSGQKTHSTALHFSADTKRLFSGTHGGTVYVWDLTTQQEVVRL
jgi:WD40 repeat protein